MAALLVLLLGILCLAAKPLARLQLPKGLKRWAKSNPRLEALARTFGSGGSQGTGRAEIVCAGVLIAAVALVALVAPATPSRWASACAVVGVGLLLTSPANDVVAALLYLVRRQDFESQAEQDAGSPGGLLGGGRWIGALERLLIVLLAFGSVPAGIAAVVAAKGVIRFPEISADTPDPKDPAANQSGRLGAKAEEFLIGSFSSWLLALLGYLLLRSVGVGQ